MSFEIQELQDIIRVIVLINLSKGNRAEEALLKQQIDKVCTGYACVEIDDLEETLEDMAAEGLVQDVEQRLFGGWPVLFYESWKKLIGLVSGSTVGYTINVARIFFPPACPFMPWQMID